MSILIDTHTHLYLPQFDEDRSEAIKRANENGIEKFYLPNVDSSSIESMMAMEKDFEGQCFPMMGLHPCSVKGNYKKELEIVKDWLFKRPFSAVGEIGIDLYWDKTFFQEQKIAFLQQIEWAKELDLPIVIHSREATDIIIEILQKVNDEKLRGIFHCFTGNVEQANAIIEMDFYLGIGGVVTFKNGGLDKTVVHLPLERMVLETDSPYLSPTPYRGKRNESAYIKLIAEKLAAVKGVDFEEVAVVTTANSEKIFAKNS